jgi:hypothetical protein
MNTMNMPGFTADFIEPRSFLAWLLKCHHITIGESLNEQEVVYEHARI